MNHPKIESYRFGKIVIDGITYRNDLIILSDHILTNWWREKGHSLSLNDLQDVIAAKPELLIIGTGAFGRMQIPTETLAMIKKHGIEVIAVETEQACTLYNQCTDNVQVIIAMHLTC